MTIVITRLYYSSRIDSIWKIESNFVIDDWSFLVNLSVTREIVNRDYFSCIINCKSYVTEDDLRKHIDKHFTDNPISIQHQQVNNTLQELTSILRRLEREVNPSFKQHTKTLLGIL